MTAALVGLLGVIAGALLGGVVNYSVDRKKQRAAAQVAALLIARELRAAATKMGSAVTTKGWWQGCLPTGEKHRLQQVAFGMPAVLAPVTDAYGIIAIWNAAGRKEPPDLVRVAEGCKAIEGAQGHLERAMRPNPLPRWRWAARRPVQVAATMLVVLGALVGLVVQRPDLDEVSVASAIEFALGENAVVECDRLGDDWLCTAYKLPPTPDVLPGAGRRLSGASPRSSAAPGRRCLPGPPVHPGGSPGLRGHGGRGLVVAQRRPEAECRPGRTRPASRSDRGVQRV